MKKWWMAAIVAAMIVIGGATIWFGATTNQPTMRLGDATFTIRVARTDAERRQGLSGTAKLDDSQAMILAFPGDNRWGVWMKDMRYPIDIIWLNESKWVVDVRRNVKPESYPTTYRPGIDARYVVEVKAGAVDRHRITIGSRAAFDAAKGTFE